jgi:hypothetical protein
MLVKLIIIDTQLYNAGFHSYNAQEIILLDHSIEDSSDATTTCEVNINAKQETPILCMSPVIISIPPIPELPHEIDSPPPRA